MEVDMQLKRSFCLALATGLLLIAAACQKETSSGPVPSVKANQAYLTAFGEPPTPAKGECFARVGYYPVRATPDQLRAVPFFLFDAKSELPLLFERLVNNPLAFAADGPLLNPFPPGSKIQVAQLAESLELALTTDQRPGAADLAAMAASLTETAGQYSQFTRVRLLFNGAAWPEMPAGGFRPDPERIIDPGPPQLLLVVGSWEPESDGPNEILADFDRPVSIERFVIEDQSGSSLEGEYFTSVFNMAVVLQPRQPSRLHEGMALRVTWQVSDQLGRQGAGTTSLPLLRNDHGATR
jgi:hypothetical protein